VNEPKPMQTSFSRSPTSALSALSISLSLSHTHPFPFWNANHSFAFSLTFSLPHSILCTIYDTSTTLHTTKKHVKTFKNKKIKKKL
jgi:hypothetical protein